MASKKGKSDSQGVDIMGIIDTQKPERILILDPQEEQSRGDKELVATTTCEISFDNEKDLLSCVQALRESDEELRNRPDSLKMWNWQQTFREGMNIIFGVAWYDREFFESRQDAYKNASHVGYYKRFGATPDNFRVEHKILANQTISVSNTKF